MNDDLTAFPHSRRALRNAAPINARPPARRGIPRTGTGTGSDPVVPAPEMSGIVPAGSADAVCLWSAVTYLQPTQLLVQPLLVQSADGV